MALGPVAIQQQMKYPMGAVLGVELMGGQEFILWPGAVRQNGHLAPNRRAPAEMAAKLQAAAIEALAEIGLGGEEAEGRGTVVVFPFHADPELRRQARAVVKKYCGANCPEPGRRVAWLPLIHQWVAAEAKARLTDGSPQRHGDAETGQEGTEGQKAEGRRQRAKGRRQRAEGRGQKGKVVVVDNEDDEEVDGEQQDEGRGVPV